MAGKATKKEVQKTYHDRNEDKNSRSSREVDHVGLGCCLILTFLLHGTLRVIYYVTVERADFKTVSLRRVVIFYIVEYLSE